MYCVAMHYGMSVVGRVGKQYQRSFHFIELGNPLLGCFYVTYILRAQVNHPPDRGNYKVTFPLVLGVGYMGPRDSI